MERTNQSAGRRERFEHCGSGCFVQHSKSTDRFRLSANFCHDRFCDRCSRARSRVIADNLRRKIDGKDCVHLILTLRHSSKPLPTQLNRLVRCFRNLRERPLWKVNVRGGAYFFELKRARDGRHWHPHLHIVMQADYMPQAALSNLWLEVTGDSDVVHIRRCAKDDATFQYVAKYASKGCDASIYEQPEWLDEALTTLKGRRICSTFGTWRGFDLDAKDDGPGDWRPICSLDQLTAAFTRGELWARGLMQSLRQKENHADPIGHPP